LAFWEAVVHWLLDCKCWRRLHPSKSVISLAACLQHIFPCVRVRSEAKHDCGVWLGENWATPPPTTSWLGHRPSLRGKGRVIFRYFEEVQRLLPYFTEL